MRSSCFHNLVHNLMQKWGSAHVRSSRTRSGREVDKEMMNWSFSYSPWFYMSFVSEKSGQKVIGLKRNFTGTVFVHFVQMLATASVTQGFECWLSFSKNVHVLYIQITGDFLLPPTTTAFCQHERSFIGHFFSVGQKYVMLYLSFYSRLT